MLPRERKNSRQKYLFNMVPNKIPQDIFINQKDTLRLSIGYCVSKSFKNYIFDQYSLQNTITTDILLGSLAVHPLNVQTSQSSITYTGLIIYTDGKNLLRLKGRE